MNFALEVEDVDETFKAGKLKYIWIKIGSLIDVNFISDINLEITKKSKKLGRSIYLEDQEGIVLEEMQHNSDLASQYITRRTSERSIQCSSLSYISYVSN